MTHSLFEPVGDPGDRVQPCTATAPAIRIKDVWGLRIPRSGSCRPRMRARRLRGENICVTEPVTLTALALVCTLRSAPAPSSSQLMAEQVLTELATHDVSSALIRAVDHDVRPGVEVDMGVGDYWPTIRAQLMAADILVLATPTWMGQPRASPSASWNASTLSFPRPTSKAGCSPTPRSPSPSPLSWARRRRPSH